MTEANKNSGDRFLDHPEVAELFDPGLNTLVSESDRGAVLVGAQLVDFHLRRLFEITAPSGASNQTLKRTLKYPGALSTFSARAEVAFLTRLIDRNLYDAISHLRHIRNDVAHSPEAFHLADHKEKLRKIFELGPNAPVGVNRLAVEVLMKSFIDNLLSLKHPTDSAELIFNEPAQVIDYLSEHPDLLKPLDERLLHWELAIGVMLICALIIYQRDAIIKKLVQ